MTFPCDPVHPEGAQKEGKRQPNKKSFSTHLLEVPLRLQLPLEFSNFPR
jgi:hypothetical protein